MVLKELREFDDTDRTEEIENQTKWGNCVLKTEQAKETCSPKKLMELAPERAEGLITDQTQVKELRKLRTGRTVGSENWKGRKNENI